MKPDSPRLTAIPPLCISPCVQVASGITDTGFIDGMRGHMRQNPISNSVLKILYILFI